jgi:hypothetical protein
VEGTNQANQSIHHPTIDRSLARVQHARNARNSESLLSSRRAILNSINSPTMFFPGRSVQEEKAKQKAVLKKLEDICISLIPEGPIREDAIVSVYEVQCGDPSCAPIDTVISIQFGKR